MRFASGDVGVPEQRDGADEHHGASLRSYVVRKFARRSKTFRQAFDPVRVRRSLPLWMT